MNSPGDSTRRRGLVTWVAIPAGLALAAFAIGALWFGSEDTVVSELSGPAAIVRDGPATTVPPMEIARAPSAPEETRAPIPAPPEPAPARSPPRVAPARAAEADDGLARLGGASDTHASVRDTSGSRAPLVVVPTGASRTVERPAPAPREAAKIAPPSRGDAPAALAELSRCPTMQACIRAVAPHLAAYGNTAALPDPGPASVAHFDQTRAAYRRALSEVRAAAKALVERPGGDRHEAALRSIFEALPQATAFELEEHELPPIRHALERVVARWVADRRAHITSTVALRIQLLTASELTPFEITFEHAPSTMSGLSELKQFMKQELTSSAELRSFGRQRHATVKLVLNPGGQFGVD